MIFTLLGRYFGDSNTKYIKTFIVGSVIYVLIHALVNSPFGDKNEIFVKYRNYLYIIFGVDCVLSGVIRGMFTKNSLDTNEDNDDYNDDDNEYSEQSIQRIPNIPEEYKEMYARQASIMAQQRIPFIPEQYREMYAKQASIMAQQRTPFIKHEEYSEHNEKNIPKEEIIIKQDITQDDKENVKEDIKEDIKEDNKEEFIEESDRDIHIKTLDSENIPVYSTK